VTATIDGRSAHLTDTITARFLEIHQGIESRVGAVATDIDMRVAQSRTSWARASKPWRASRAADVRPATA